jgi:hypothetical protein
MPKEIDDDDISFVQDVVQRVGQQERRRGGPRFTKDVVDVVRNLVVATEALQETTKQIQSTMTGLMTAVEGRAFGDRSDGLNFRVGVLERVVVTNRNMLRTILGLCAFIAGRIGYVQLVHSWPVIMHTMGYK